MATNINDVLENFDFTDSIVTEIKWENQLLDLALVVDYYWDLQEGRSETRLLKLTFKNCAKADFQFKRDLLPLPNELVNPESCYTIVLFKANRTSQLIEQYGIDRLKHIELFTLDYSTAWLSVLCDEVILEQIDS
ncbi:hypothetical protein AB4Z29_05180 [Paenibacillus sp. 2TAB23]|uniref:hypothetical protein n=1 Tax=Paenibacillus sp. 2TAB23 TaxID=3233004 RepID=UPI003F9CC325